MKIILIDAASNRVERDFSTFKEAAGECGTSTKLVCNGRAGHLAFASTISTDVEFVETEPAFRYFSFAHLPTRLQDVSKRFYDVAEWLVLSVPVSSERTKAIDRLLESKDAAIRASLIT